MNATQNYNEEQISDDDDGGGHQEHKPVNWSNPRCPGKMEKLDI